MIKFDKKAMNKFNQIPTVSNQNYFLVYIALNMLMVKIVDFEATNKDDLILKNYEFFR